MPSQKPNLPVCGVRDTVKALLLPSFAGSATASVLSDLRLTGELPASDLSTVML